MSGSVASADWGLVLSGGAACGLANIGVLDVLHEHGLQPRCISGSSMGAIIAAVYALGYPPRDLHRVAAAMEPAKVVRFSSRPLHSGLHGGILEQELERHLGPLLGDATIADCEILFVCVAGRVLQPIRWERALFPGFTEHVRARIEVHVFPGDTRLMDAVRASSAIPVVFSPARIGDDEFIDLVHFGAIPARSLRAAHAPRTVIATDTQPAYDRIEPFLPSPMREFLVAGREETAQSMAACDLVMRPDLPASMLRFDRSEDFIAAGKACAREHLPAIDRLLGATAIQRDGSNDGER